MYNIPVLIRQISKRGLDQAWGVGFGGGRGRYPVMCEHQSYNFGTAQIICVSRKDLLLCNSLGGGGVLCLGKDKVYNICSLAARSSMSGGRGDSHLHQNLGIILEIPGQGFLPLYCIGATTECELFHLYVPFSNVLSCALVCPVYIYQLPLKSVQITK